MAFKKTKKENTGSNVDFDAYNKYMVETTGCGAGDTLTGVVVGYYGLGEQKQPDALYLYDEKNSKQSDKLEGSLTEVGEIAEALGEDVEEVGNYKMFNPKNNSFLRTEEVYYDNDTKYENVDVYGYFQKNKEAFTLVVEFDDIMLDKAQFFAPEDEYTEGEHNLKPYRLHFGRLGFETGSDGKTFTVIQPPFYEKHVYNEGNYGCAKTSNLHAMAAAAGLLDEKKGVFMPEDADQLLGKVFNFPVTVKLNDAGYLVESINKPAKLPQSMKKMYPDLDSEDDRIFGIDFAGDNDLDTLREVPEIIKRTMKNAANFEGSGLQRDFEALENSSTDKKKVAERTVEEQDDTPDQEDDLDDEDIPF